MRAHRLLSAFLCFLCVLCVPAFAFAQEASEAEAPQLHMGFQHVPRDGTGRLGGSGVELLEVTAHDTMYWPTHVFAELFSAASHDRYWRQAEVRGETRWLLRPERMGEYAALIDAMATACLDFCEEVAGGKPMGASDGRIRVFPDLETGTIGRTPYIEPGAEGYGSRDIAAMNYLCNRIELLGGRRWGDRGDGGEGGDGEPLEVLAGPYRPLRPYGHWAGLATSATEATFARQWHDPVWPLLDRRIVWVHCYLPTREADFNRRGQTWRQYAEATIRGQFESIVASGAAPDEVWVVDWVYAGIDGAKSEALLDALEAVLAERAWPWSTHVAICGGWASVGYHVDAPVEKITSDPLELTLPAAQCGRVLGEVWRREVEAAWQRVFSAASE